eukprot:Platyproteum_vivax@DN3045_c0_g1_i2.p1
MCGLFVHRLRGCWSLHGLARMQTGSCCGEKCGGLTATPPKLSFQIDCTLQKGGTFLSRFCVASRVRALVLNNNRDLQNAGMRAFSEVSCLPYLEELSVGVCNIAGKRGGRAIGQLLAKCPRMSSFTLRGNPDLQADGVLSMAKQIAMGSGSLPLQHLHLVGCGCDGFDGGAAVGLLLLYTPNLIDLSLFYNCLGTAGLAALASTWDKNLCHGNLTTLNFSTCGLSQSETGTALGSILKLSSKLEALDICGNCVSSGFWKRLIDAIGSTRLALSTLDCSETIPEEMMRLLPSHQ